MSLIIQQLTYIHPDKEVLFNNLNLSVENGQKIALIGNNGSGKSTFIKIISGELIQASGSISFSSDPYYIPQHFGQYDGINISQALKVDKKINALNAILNGDVSEDNFTVLADDWNIEERIKSALSFWGLDNINLSDEFAKLSGGEKTKIFLAGIDIHSPEIILMDEPTNHLDLDSRNRLYDFINNSNKTIIIITHDRNLLNLLPEIYELNKNGLTYYPGNYEFYKIQKDQELNSLQAKLEDREKELRSARKTAREVAERQQKLDNRGEKRSLKKGISRMGMNTLRDKAEKSTTKLNNIHSEKIESISDNISELRSKFPDLKSMKTDFNTSSLHTGKILITAENLNFTFGNENLWEPSLNFKIKSGDRIQIKGNNGSGKTTLLKLITGELTASEGILNKIDFNYVYLDQEYSIINDKISVYEQALKFNKTLQEHEIKTILTRFLFSYDTWDKLCKKLSGGEKMKLSLCCLMISANTPDIFILDEPTNNIDIRNIEILTSTIKEYKGTVLVVSHDEYFISQIGANQSIFLS